MRLTSVLFASLLTFVGPGATAQNSEDAARRWAIDAHIGGNVVQAASSSNTNVPKCRTGSTSNSGLLTKLHVEYYLPDSPFSLKAGYEHEELNYLKGDGCDDLNQLMVGGRWYPAPACWKIAPYVGGDMLYSFDAPRGPFEMSSHLSWSDNGISQTTYTYTVQGIAKAPRFSLAPVVGADIFLFTSIALQVEYGYRFGLDAPYRVRYTEGGSTRSSEYHGRMHRHVFSVGLKLTFPFRWTHSDSNGLLQGLFDNL